jgi:ligand-binding sensor domain-containing protein
MTPFALMKKRARVFFGCLFLLLVNSSVQGQTPRTHLSQMEHSTWRLQDAVFAGAPRGIAQTKDGYLWIGTENGLVRFDGVRFVPWAPPPGPQLSNQRIKSLLAARDGSLWIGTNSGLSHWTNGKLINYPSSVANIGSILEARDGTIWVTRLRLRDLSGPICRVEGFQLHCFGKADGIASPAGDPSVEDSQGNLWFGMLGELIERKNGEFLTYPAYKNANKEMDTFEGLTDGPGGALWTGMYHAGAGSGLEQFFDGRWRRFTAPGFPASSQEIMRLFRDRDGDLWVGTAHHGIFRISGQQLDRFDRSDGLSSNSVTGFQQDAEGNIWVTTANGLDVFRKRPVITYSSREGLSADGAEAVLSRQDGSIWIANNTAIDSIHGEEIRSIGAHEGLPGTVVTSLFEDRHGQLWVGVDSGLAVYREGHFQTIYPKGKDRNVTAIAEDAVGDIWAMFSGPDAKLLRIRDFKVQEEFDPETVPRGFSVVSDDRGGVWVSLFKGSFLHIKDGVRSEISLKKFQPDASHPVAVYNMMVDTDTTLWGASSRGLIGYRSGKAQALLQENGLPCSSLYSVIADRHRAL